ncbi:MAG: peptidylprolyl isomerase [Leptospiraceae bacterium]|nr:peptidylprolyl isomerase [Leptospiraceae bacterium]MCP5502280.1 peptidylprolyl isomerase [Leptospiraceae bacterium]
MQISKNKVVTIDYTLKSDEGEILDSSSGREPLAYIQGTSSIIPGLENALEGKVEGDSLQVKVSPTEGYGEYNEAMKHSIPRVQFGDIQDIRPGMQFQAQTEQGFQILTVLEAGESEILVDANHPLAGMNLNFDVTVKGVREATSEEISHGHVHGPGGHHH